MAKVKVNKAALMDLMGKCGELGNTFKRLECETVAEDSGAATLRWENARLREALKAAGDGSSEREAWERKLDAEAECGRLRTIKTALEIKLAEMKACADRLRDQIRGYMDADERTRADIRVQRERIKRASELVETLRSASIVYANPDTRAALRAAADLLEEALK